MANRPCVSNLGFQFLILGYVPRMRSHSSVCSMLSIPHFRIQYFVVFVQLGIVSFNSSFQDTGETHHGSHAPFLLSIPHFRILGEGLGFFGGYALLSIPHFRILEDFRGSTRLTWSNFQFLILGYEARVDKRRAHIPCFQFLILGYRLLRPVKSEPRRYTFQFLILGYLSSVVDGEFIVAVDFQFLILGYFTHASLT